MELYTTLVRLKEAMNGGVLPPMTPVQGQALKLIDPAFTIGLGALAEDAERGLRSPLRGCGHYFHDLRKHLNKSHRGAGGPDAVLRALSIPRTAVLSSRSLRSRRVAITRRLVASGVVPDLGARIRGKSIAPPVRTLGNGGRARGMAKATVGSRNLQNRCVAQLTHKLVDLHHKLRRTPSFSEAEAEFGGAIAEAIRVTFGTWANAIAHCGLQRARGMRWTSEDVLESFRAWHAEHGSLPTADDANAAGRTPLLPKPCTVQRVLGVDRWSEAMQIVASILDIRGGRYGLPERKSA